MDPLDSHRRSREARRYWDQAAASFDDEPDHGLRDPVVRAAWTGLLRAWLPGEPTSILDVGCGTGSLSVLLAGLGHAVSGIDLSPAMIARARAKAAAAGLQIDFQAMDAAAPPLSPGLYDGLVCRHLLWALPDPAQALLNWSALLKPGGRLVLVEGYWSAGGLHAKQILDALPPAFAPAAVVDLSGRPALWGRPVTDERYLVAADRRA